MKLRKIFRKEFFITLFIKQNKWHRYSVLMHTLAVTYHTFRAKEYKMLTAALLHDIGKPIVAFQDDSDKKSGEYSFTNHEEISYQLIKKTPFISSYSKKLVRYHYLLRGMEVAKKKGKMSKYKRMKRIFDKLDTNFVNDLKKFIIYDDLGKK
jgi:hypothetical protein